MAFSSGRIAVMDMVRIGICLNLLGVLAVLLVINTTGSWLFELSELPAWARLREEADEPLRNATASNPLDS